MSRFTEAVQAALDVAVDEGEHVAVTVVVERVMADATDLVASESDRLVRSAIARTVSDLARVETSDGGQMSLGLSLPAIISTPDGIIRTDKANWADLEAGKDIRSENVARAQARLDDYNDALDELRPVMEGHDITVGEAVASMAARPVA